MGLFDETSDPPAKPDKQRIGNGRESLFEWLIKKAESDLGLAQAFAAGEAERADQIKRLESTLVRQISDLRHHLLEGRAAELDEIKSEIFAFTDRMARIETAKAPSAVVKEFIQQELSSFRAYVNERQLQLEGQQAGVQKLGDALNAHINALEEQIRAKFDALRSTQGEMRELRSEAQNLDQRVAQAESVALQIKTLSARNAQQCEQTAEVLRRDLASIKTELTEQRSDLNSAGSRINELQQGLGAKIEAIHIRLAQDFGAMKGYDSRIGRLDVELADLTKRFAVAENLARQTHEIVQRDTQSTLDIRQELEAKLQSLKAVLDESQTRYTHISNLEDTVRVQIEELREQVEQTFAGLERRDGELEHNVRLLEANLSARAAKQEEILLDSLRSVAIGQDELRQLKPELQSMAQHISRLETAAHRAQAQADANAHRIDELAGNVQRDLGSFKAELAEQQRNFRLPDDQIREIENRLGGRVEVLERQFAMEREGFEHWEKGLRQSFSSELSAIHSRLSERQSQVEHRQARFDQLEHNLAARFDALESQLTERLRHFDSSDHRWGEFESQIRNLAERTGRLESMGGDAKASIATAHQQFEESIAGLRSEIVAVTARLEVVSKERGETLVRGLEESFAAKLQALQHDTELKLSSLDAREIERVQRAEELVNNLNTELAALKSAMEQRQTEPPAPGTVSQAIMDALDAKVSDLDRKLAEQIHLLEGRDAERARHAQTIVESLQHQISSLRTSVGNDAAASVKSAIQGLQEAIIAKTEERQEQLEGKLILLEKRDAERRQQLEQSIDGLKAELDAIRADLNRQPDPAISFDPALRGLEENLSAKIYGLSQHVAQKFSALDKRDAELQELKERSHSLIQRVAQLTTAVQALQKTGPSATPPVASLQSEVAEKAPEANTGEEQSATVTRYSSEKEQLIKLQEKMSLEIERVRAELKERSGRWKMRKSAS